MSKSVKIWLIVAVCLTVAGIAVFAAAMSVGQWNFSVFNTEKYVTNTYDINEDFKNISINTKTADIVFAKSDDGKCRVVCFERENEKEKHVVSVTYGTLTIRAEDEREWFDHIGINFRSPKVTVYLPGSEYASLVIKGTTGDVTIPEDFSFSDADITLTTGDVYLCSRISGVLAISLTTGEIEVAGILPCGITLSVTTGEIELTDVNCSGDVNVTVTTGSLTANNVTCRNFTTDGSTGDVKLKKVVAGETISAQRSTGDVRFDGIDAASITIRTTTGDVSGKVLSEKIFFTKTSTGHVSVPQSMTGGKCEITTTTGDVRVSVGDN